VFRTKRFDLSDKLTSHAARCPHRDYDRLFLWTVVIVGAALILFSLANREAKEPLPKRLTTTESVQYGTEHNEISQTDHGGNK
jgi:hypothetical protein